MELLVEALGGQVKEGEAILFEQVIEFCINDKLILRPIEGVGSHHVGGIVAKVGQEVLHVAGVLNKYSFDPVGYQVCDTIRVGSTSDKDLSGPMFLCDVYVYQTQLVPNELSTLLPSIEGYPEKEMKCNDFLLCEIN